MYDTVPQSQTVCSLFLKKTPKETTLLVRTACCTWLYASVHFPQTLRDFIVCFFPIFLPHCCFSICEVSGVWLARAEARWWWGHGVDPSVPAVGGIGAERGPDREADVAMGLPSGGGLILRVALPCRLHNYERKRGRERGKKSVQQFPQMYAEALLLWDVSISKVLADEYEF